MSTTTTQSHQNVTVSSDLSYDAYMPRTTLNIDSDALLVAKDHAAKRGQSLGDAVSELIRRGGQRDLVFEHTGPFAVVKLPHDTPAVTAEHVKRALEDAV